MIHLLLLLALYFLPTIVASHRGLRTGGVGLLNLLFGWTGVGWLALLVWSLTSQPPFVYYVAAQPGPYVPAQSYGPSRMR